MESFRQKVILWHREVRLFLRVLYESEFLIVMEECAYNHEQFNDTLKKRLFISIHVTFSITFPFLFICFPSELHLV